MNEPFRFIVARTPKSGGDWVASLLLQFCNGNLLSGCGLYNFQRSDSHSLSWAGGYKIEEIVLSEELQKISATEIRKKMREES